VITGSIALERISGGLTISIDLTGVTKLQ